MRCLEVSAFFGDGMVIQQGMKVPVWGKAAPGAAISLSFLGKVYDGRADASGQWELCLEPAPSGGPWVMEIRADGTAAAWGGETLILRDLYGGDVWLCAGQSNMELPLERLRDQYPGEWKPPVNSLIRQFRIPPSWDFSSPRAGIDRAGTGQAHWTAATTESLADFSGTAWFFAKALYKRQGVPIGLLHAALGGAPVEAFMSREALESYPGKIAQGELYADIHVREATIRANEQAQQDWDEQSLRTDPGLAPGAEWFRPDTDEAAWGQISLPGPFAGLEGFCGVVWLRRRFTAPRTMAGKPVRLWLGTIIDADTAYINGVEVGGTTYRYPPRKYAVPADASGGLLREGENQLTLRVVCKTGGGGLTPDKPFRIFSAGGSIELAGTWRCRTGPRLETCPPGFFIQWQPMGLFNGMIAPALRNAIRGVLWYQGESNEWQAGEYAPLFQAMIRCWRDRAPALPFLFVQLPLFGPPEDNTETSRWAVVREAQAATLALPGTGMAAALDTGEWNDLHPLNKRAVGERLALAAEKLVYGITNTSPGPMLRDISRQGNTLILSFDYCGRGLVLRSPVSAPGAGIPAAAPEAGALITAPYITVAAGDGTREPRPALIRNGNCLAVDASGMTGPFKLLYAWADNPLDRFFYNDEGLPMLPFRALCPENAPQKQKTA
ncbi:MAG: hypothetical protein LBT11_02330 [Treponema sp.]|jgi:sialate O-acetylesterase|nr:hypothetical protein [Treponema sp.]